jgi:MFS family permease
MLCITENERLRECTAVVCVKRPKASSRSSCTALQDPLEQGEADGARRQAQLDAVQHRLRQSRRRTLIVLFVEAAVAVIGVVIGVGCAIIAWQWRDVFFGVSALMLILVCPVCAFAFYRLRRRGLEWADRTPEGTLRYALLRLRLARSLLQMQYWGGGTLLFLVALVWVGAVTGLISRFYPLRLISAIWISAAIATIAWSKWRLRRNDEEHLNCERLLAAFARPIPGVSAAEHT